MASDSRKQADSDLDLHAQLRRGDATTSNIVARRAAGYVPGVVYGEGKEPTQIKMNYNYLLKRLKAGRFLQTLFNLKVEGGEEVHVICRGVKRDQVKNLPTHVDFLRISDETRISLFIHVSFINHEASPGLRAGGTLTIVRPEVELEVRAGDIPDHITVDLTGKRFGDVIRISDVELPEDVKPIIARDFVIANIGQASELVASARGLSIGHSSSEDIDQNVVEVESSPHMDELGNGYADHDQFGELVRMNVEASDAIVKSKLLLEKMRSRIQGEHLDEK